MNAAFLLGIPFTFRARSGVRMTEPARWRKAALAGLALLALAAVFAGAAWWRPQRAAVPAAPANQPLLPRPVAVVPGVYLLGGMAPAAAYAVETSDGLVLIDSGLEADAIVRQFDALHLDLGRLRAILLTHVHADHSLGAQHLRTQTGARVYAGRADCPPLREGGPREAFFSVYHMPQLTTHATIVDVELAGGESLPFGETRIEVIATPGHTPGSVCYLLERPGLRALFTGDVIQHLDPAAEGALGTYAAYLPPLYRGNVCDYLASLRKLRGLPVPDLVLPGHPRMGPVPQNPHVPAVQWQALLDQGIAEMERLLKRYETDGANFLDGIPKQLLPGLHYLGDFAHAAVYCLDAPTGLFLFDAPGGDALNDFLAARFKKLGWEGRRLTAVLLTSADEAATAGLAPLVGRTGCQVMVPKAGLDEVRHLCPSGAKVLTEDDLKKAAWFEVQVLPLAGRGLAPVAYQVSWAGKTVLVSGRIPVKGSVPALEELVRDVARAGGSIPEFRRSLQRLAKVRPDLWLPAVPVHGQNANLYDREWEKILENNGRLFP
jgi:metallo-beta-lactamase class B